MAESVGSIKAEIILRNEQFKRSVDESKRKVAELNQYARTASDGVKKMGNTSDKASKGVEKLGNKSKEVSKDIKAIHRASLAVGGAIAAGIGGTVAVAANFEQKLKDIQAVSGVTQSEMQQLHDLAIEMGQKTKFSAAEAAQGIEELIKAGVSLKDIINGGLEGALNLAVAGELDLGEAAQVASTALNSFRKDNLKVSDAANILAGAANASATDVREMAQGLSQVSAVASGMGMSFRDTSTALAIFAQAGLRGSDAGTSLKTMLLNLVPQTKQQIALFQQLGLITEDGANAFYDANGNLKSLSEIAGILQDKLKGMTNEQRQATLQILFGTDAVRAANILYKEGADGVKKMWDAMSKVKAADVAKTKMDTLKGSFEQFKGALETLGITIGEEFLPTFKGIVDNATNVIEGLGKVNPALMSTGLEAMAAAAGVGILLTTIAKISAALRAFALTPVGAAITGLSLLAGVAVGVTQGLKHMSEVNTEVADKMAKTHAENSKMIDEFEKLRLKSHLTNDEFAEYVDLQTRIKRETDPNVVKDLKDRMDELQQKSGLSNDELSTMVQLNEDLTDALPEATAKITDQGNRIADTTGKLRDYNRELAEYTLRKYEEELNKAIANHKENVAKMKETQDKLRAGLEDEKRLREMLMNYDQKQIDKMIDQIRLKISSRTTTAQERVELQKQLKYLEQGKDGLRKLLALRMEENDQLQKTLDKQKKQVDKVEEIRQKMIKVAFEEEGLNYKRGRGVDWLQEQIDKLEAQKRKIQQTTPANERNTAAYHNQIKEIDTQISKFQRVLDKVKEINKEAGKSINKKVTLTLDEQRYQAGIDRVYQNLKARGLVRHQGGIVSDPSDELPKFHDGGSPAFRTLPMFNEVDVRLLRNEMVLTEAQQAQLFRMLDNPASSPSVTIENDERMLEMLSAIHREIKRNKGDVVLNINGREFARATTKDIAEEMERLARIQQRARGIW